MGIGDVTRVDPDRVRACWYVDTGMYDVAGYGAAYLLDGDRPALVETGIGTHHGRVLDLLDRVGVDREDLAFICPTHVHLDHAGGAGFLAHACPNATVAVHERGAPHLADPDRLVAGTKAAVGDQWRHYVEPDPVPEDRLRPMADGDEVDLGDRRLRAVAVPGHARHQHAFHLVDDAAVFTADAAGIYTAGSDRLYPTSPPPEFDLEQCLRDVDRLRDLGARTLLFTHFGPAPTDGLLDRYGTVLREWVASVREARARAPSDEVAIERLVSAHAAVEEWGRDKATAETAMNVRGVIGYLDR